MSEEKVEIEVDATPISTVLEAIDKLGYKYVARGIQCLEDEDIQEEMEKGGVWIIAPHQGPCEDGEAYRVLVGPEQVEELESAVRMIEALYDYLCTTLPKEYSPSKALIKVIDCVNNKLSEE